MEAGCSQIRKRNLVENECLQRRQPPRFSRKYSYQDLPIVRGTLFFFPYFMSVSVIAWIMTCRLLHTKRKILVCTYIFLHLDEYLYHSEQAGPVTTFKHCSCPFGGEPMKGLTKACDCFGESSFVETHWVGPASNCHSTQSLEAF